MQALMDKPYEELLVNLHEESSLRALVSCLELLCSIIISFNNVFQACRYVCVSEDVCMCVCVSEDVCVCVCVCV